MFKRLELLIQNNQLKQENTKIKEENRLNRQDTDILKLKQYKAEVLARDTLKQLNKIQEILNTGLAEDVKKQNINIVVNNLRKSNLDIIKELDNSLKSF